jgi:hypothetical protein
MQPMFSLEDLSQLAKLTIFRFPPASWVQGGTGENNVHRGTLICAASGLRCIGAALPAIRGAFSNGDNYGEQDWQGQANNILRVGSIVKIIMA